MSKQEVQSKEEQYFEWWLQELQDNGYINNFAKAKTYELITEVKNYYIEYLKTKEKEKTQIIENSHSYTPDYEIHWNIKAKDIFAQTFIYPSEYYKEKTIKLDNNCFWQVKGTKCLVEVKGGFSLHGQLRNNSVDRKLLLSVYKQYVNLIKIPDLFKATFTPTKYLLTDTGKQNRIIHFKIKSLQEFEMSNVLCLSRAMREEANWLTNSIDLTLKTT